MKNWLDTGFDSLNDFNYAPQLSALLNAMDSTDELPKTILYYLNSKDVDMLAAMAGNYQGNSTVSGRFNLAAPGGSVTISVGMERQMDALVRRWAYLPLCRNAYRLKEASSFPRHEYFDVSCAASWVPGWRM